MHLPPREGTPPSTDRCHNRAKVRARCTKGIDLKEKKEQKRKGISYLLSQFILKPLQTVPFLRAHTRGSSCLNTVQDRRQHERR